MSYRIKINHVEPKVYKAMQAMDHYIKGTSLTTNSAAEFFDRTYVAKIQ